MLETFKREIYHSLRLPLTKVIIFDIEGFGLDIRFNPDLPLYTICFLEVDENGKPKIKRCRNIDVAIAFLSSRLESGFSAFAHNAKFDLSVLTVRGFKHHIQPGQISIGCTQVMAYIQDTTLDSYSLDALTGQKTDVISAFDRAFMFVNTPKPANLREFWAIDWSNNEEALELIEDYCVDDLKATYSLYKRLAKWYNEHPKFIAPLLEIEFPMLEVLGQIESNGAYVNQERLISLVTDLEAELQTAKEEINNRYPGLPKLSWNNNTSDFEPVVIVYKKKFKSNPGDKYPVDPDCDFHCNTHKSYISEYMGSDGTVVASNPYTLGEHCKLVCYNSAAATGHNYWILKNEVPELLEGASLTPKGRPSLNKDFFNDIAEQLPEHLPIAKVIKMEKYISMCKGLQEHIGEDGRIRCNVNHTLTRTTRLSTSNPNLQNIPKPFEDKHPAYKTSKDYGMRFRQLFTAHDDEHIMLVADLDRIEVVVLAWFLFMVMKDRELMDIVNSGADVHGANSERWNITRNLAKTLLFLLIYGGSPALIYKRGMTKSLAEAKKVFKAVDEGQPTINKLKTHCWQAAIKRGERENDQPYVTNPFNGRGVYPELKSQARWLRGRGERMSFNFAIQKTARDVLHLLLLMSSPHILQEHGLLVNVVHDEAIIEVRKENADALVELLNGVWGARYDILPGVRINGEWHKGESWYEAK